MLKKWKRVISSTLCGAICATPLLAGLAPQRSYAAEPAPQTLPIYMDSEHYSFKERAADMISKMSISQKASQMNGSASPSITLSDGKVIPSYGWWNEALHGVSRYQLNASGNATTINNATSYPIGLSMGSSWDPELMHKVATAISDEARETAPDSDRMLTFYSPTINLARDTRWGRTDETFSEDPLLTAGIAGQFVNGLEGKNMDGSLIDPNGYLKTVSTIKHYTANNSEVNRLNGSSDVTGRELREFYTKPYREIIKNTDVTSIMSSYNSVNGTPVTLDRNLMETFLRQTFGFSGYVTTDCDSIAMAVSPSRQNYMYPGMTRAMTTQEGYAWAAMFGTNLVCNAGYAGSSYGAELPGAAAAKLPTPSGIFTENAIDVDMLDLYTTRMKLGEFDDTVRNAAGIIQSSTNKVSWYDDAIARRTALGNGSLWTFNSGTGGDGKNITQERSDIARQAAAESLILLRNNPVASNGNKPVLPINVPSTGEFKVVVYGLNANYNTTNNSFFLGGYSSGSGASGIAKMVNPYNGIKAEIQKINPNAVVDWKKGFTNTGTTYAGMTTLDNAAIDLASGYDLAIVALGTEQATAAEDSDRGGNTNPNNTLPGAQLALANAVAVKNPKTVTVIESTSPDDLSTLSADVPSLLWSGYNGQVKGLGLADVLLGKYNPSGRTSTLWFKNDQFPSIRSYRITPGPDTYKTGNNTSASTTVTSPGRTYMYYDGSKGAPLYSFGYGMSYSNFAYSNMTVTGLGAGNSVDANDTINVSMNITNTSDRDGNDIVELYASTPDSTQTGVNQRPIKRLIGFKKVMVNAGQTVPVTITVKVPDLRFYDEAAGKWVMDTGRHNLQFSTSSADADIKLNKDIFVTGSLAPKLSVVTAKPRQDSDVALDIPTRVFFDKGKTVLPQVTVAMNDDSLYGYIAKGSSKAMPAGMTVTYSSNRPGVVSVAGDQITTVAAGVATITATVSYAGEQRSTDFIVYVNPATTLKDLKINGTTVSGFDPSINQYNVVVPFEQSATPVVAAASANADSVVTIVQANGIPGTANITVTDSTFSKVYTVNFGRPPVSAEFKGATALDSHYSVVRQDSNYSFDTNNGVTIRTKQAAVNAVQNLVMQPAIGDFVSQTAMNFSATPTVNNQQGGLIYYQDDSNYVKLVYERSTGTTNRIALYKVVNGTATVVTGNTNSAGNTKMYLRLIRSNGTISAQWSADGVTWSNYSGTAAVNFAAPQLGLIATNGNVSADALNVSFEYLRIGSLDALNPVADKIQKGGVDIPGFDPRITTYDVVVPEDALPEDYEYSVECGDGLTCVVNQATTIPGNATAVITSPFGTTTYSFKLNYRAESFNFVNTTSENLSNFWTILKQDAANYSLVQGKGLRLPTLTGDIYQTNAAWNNVFTAPAGGDWDIVTKVHYPVAPSATYQQFAFLAWQDEDNYVKLDAENNGSGILVQSGREINKVFASSGTNAVNANGDAALTVYLRMAKTGNSYQCSYSLDGINYTNVGTAINLSLNNIKMGLFATKNTASSPVIDTYVEYVQVLNTNDALPVTPAQMKINAATKVSEYVRTLLPESVQFSEGSNTVQLVNSITPTYTISYGSSDASILSATGSVTQSVYTREITYTYTISDGTNNVVSTPIHLSVPGSEGSAPQVGAKASISGPSSPVVVGQSVNLPIGVTGLTHNFNILSVELKYDPAMIEFATSLNNGVNVLQAGSVTSTRNGLQVLETAVKPETGEILIIMGVTGKFLTGDGELFVLHGKAKGDAAAGTTNVAVTKQEIVGDENHYSLPDTSQATVNIQVVQADKMALIASVAAAQALLQAAVEGNQEGQYPAGSKAILQAAIDSASVVVHNGASTPSDVANALVTLNNAVTSFTGSIIHINKEALNTAITDAQQVLNSAVEGSAPGEYPTGTKAVLQAAIDAAIGVRDSITVTQSEVNLAVTTLTTAESTFRASVNSTTSPSVDLEALNQAIAAAQAKVSKATVGNKIGQYPEVAIMNLQAAIDAANNVKVNSGTTQSMVDAAVVTLNDATTTFTTKIVTLVPGATSITIQDLSILAKYYGVKKDQPDWDKVEKADLFDNHEITILELAAVARMIVANWLQ
ncbi:glycoside hydrolase family 3 C-terminal domain-containing protein [Paenibacillus chondroitinus]|uniref:Glycoside hydrolase family 3 C-terminal domain-containing protein n=1 Tax=Paenibacillus chondroitinus TaxID=59842 RepID=A0ABU6DCP5_9BACL|nr:MULTISPECIES: glycoside hydrolase family 3 N-terminal domain-containing protein [Paenibacillus]MCY9656432.1 glycoside hydrolase family 3 C-terminal domain-containing protein [Paenibacillus anseongense]MEB4795256.1 glycoside hydrolase family 3 C-terminal domain-containing protein [Paenibacillus chondroitinus]